jgi:fructose-1,6-bisphosphatase/inositol monophosphatase family enzyme
MPSPRPGDAAPATGATRFFRMTLSSPQLERARRLLCAMQDFIRDTLLAARNRQAATFSRIVAVTAADTIYQVDKLSEAAIFSWFDAHWPKRWPVQLVMEGIEDGEIATFPRGTPVEKTLLKCIIDPIDGTRNLMYDKRSAWALAGLAPQRGPATGLRDIVVAAMTELPTSKQWRADQLSVVRGAGPRGVVAHAFDLRTRRRRPLAVRPSQARDFRQGFASFARFFPEGKTLAAQIEEALWRTLHGPDAPTALVFDDQYITTGGQLYELIVGHDRMLGDLRPLVFAKLGLRTSLTCHPYDICVELILREAGGFVEHPRGGVLDAPLDTTSPIAWVGFANARLARLVRPILPGLLQRYC